MRRTLVRLRTGISGLALWLTLLMLAAPVALAADGEGLYGRTDDKVITFFCFGVIAFFAILVTVLSLIQMRLEARKERRRSDLERLS
jgi:hypothetical protein